MKAWTPRHLARKHGVAIVYAKDEDFPEIDQASADFTYARLMASRDDLETGVSDAERARIHAPIGLAIGAVSPAEIAVAIMGEITARLRLKADEAEAA